MTQYIISKVDPSVSASYNLLQELNIISTEDKVTTIDFDNPEKTKDICPEELMKIYREIDIDANDLLVVLNGSGHFHHHTYGICRAIVDKQEIDYTIIDYDQHGDCLPKNRESTTPRDQTNGCKKNDELNLGNHIGKLIRHSEHAKKGIIIGADELIGSSYTFDTELLKDQIEIYPYHTQKGHFRNIQNEPDIDCITKKYDHKSNTLDIEWHTIKNEGIREITNHALERIETDKVYITVDLDVLKKKYATTEWTPGHMKLEELLDSIDIIKKEKNIIGIDITGSKNPNYTQHTLYTIAAIVNEITDGPHKREFFYPKISQNNPYH